MKERPLNFKINDDKTLVVRDDKTEKKLVKAYDEIRFGVATLVDHHKKGILEVGFKETLLSLSEHYVKNLCDIMGYDGALKKEFEERHKEIRSLNEENRELRRQIGEKVSNDDVREKLKNISSSIRKWWNIEGFGHMGDDYFIGNGFFKARLSGMITEAYYDNKELTEKDKVSKLRKIGFEIKDDDGKHALDTDNNRELLKKLLQRKYPSLEIISYSSYCGRKEDAQLRDIEIMIYNLDDIKY